MGDLENMIEEVKQGELERVRAILESDERLANQRDESGATPLHYATLNGHRQIVQLLLERGADINSTDSQFGATRSEEHTSELQSRLHLVCRLLLEKKKNTIAGSCLPVCIGYLLSACV